MKYRYRIIIERWTSEEGWRDWKVIGPRLPYFPIHFRIRQFTVGIARTWLGFSMEHRDNLIIVDFGPVKILRKKAG